MRTNTTVSFFARLHRDGHAYYGSWVAPAIEAGPLYEVVMQNPPAKLLRGKRKLTHRQHFEWLEGLRNSGSLVVVKEL